MAGSLAENFRHIILSGISDYLWQEVNLDSTRIWFFEVIIWWHNYLNSGSSLSSLLKQGTGTTPANPLNELEKPKIKLEKKNLALLDNKFKRDWIMPLCNFVDTWKKSRLASVQDSIKPCIYQTVGNSMWCFLCPVINLPVGSTASGDSVKSGASQRFRPSGRSKRPARSSKLRGQKHKLDSLHLRQQRCKCNMYTFYRFTFQSHFAPNRFRSILRQDCLKDSDE